MLVRWFYHLGRYLRFLRQIINKPESFRMYWIETMRQMNSIGVGSLGIIIMISVFIGAVTALQTAFQFIGSIIPKYYVGFIVRDSMFLELAPTFSCLVLAGKVGSHVASELGTMRVTEQIDALKIMGVNAVSYLVGPKILAAVVMVPALVIFSGFLGLVGGYVAVSFTGAIEVGDYHRGIFAFYNPLFIRIMLIKALVFAFLLTSISCYQGYYVKGGALEIGNSSTRAVVYSSVMILVADYVLALVLT